MHADSSSSSSSSSSPSPSPSSLAAATRQRSPWVVLAVLCSSVFIIVVDGTIVNVALPTFIRELGATTSELQWIVDAYVLVFAGLLMAAGSIGDRFGRKGVLQLGLLVFGATSIMASLADSAGELIGWRAAMGVGGALIFPATLALLVNVFTDARQRAVAIAVWAATSGLAVALGPVAGGLLLRHYSWGSVFLVNVPVIVVAMVLIGRLVPTSRDTTVHRLDPLGTLLSIAGITVLVWAVIEGPKHGWLSLSSAVAFGLAAGLLVGFVAWERRTDHPMLDVSVFTNLRFTAGSVSVTFAFFALFGFIFMVTQYFQVVRGYDTLEAGVRTVPFALFTGVAAPLSAKLVHRFGTKAVVAAGLTSMSLGFAWTTFDTADASYWLIVGQMLFMGGGLGLVNAPATEAIMGSLPPEKAGVGSAVNDTARELGGTLGVAIVGSLFASIYAGRLGELLAGSPVPAAAVAIAQQSAGAGAEVARQAGEQAGPTAGELVGNAVNTAFMEGFHAGSWVSAAVVLAGAAMAWRWLPSRAVAAAEVVAGAGAVRAAAVQAGAVQAGAVRAAAVETPASAALY
ncbi:MAG: DHA2 family efflux MFS transporter permease subunit [Actinomycetota bacterium]|nr:DHA2 family efflux MFS transporter permease subunit [Actinomycetota bacterium]